MNIRKKNIKVSNTIILQRWVIQIFLKTIEWHAKVLLYSPTIKLNEGGGGDNARNYSFHVVFSLEFVENILSQQISTSTKKLNSNYQMEN